MSSTSGHKMILGSIVIGACAVLCVAIVAQAQYNTYDSDSNSDSDGNPILTQSELGKLVRGSSKVQAHQNFNNQNAAATRNLYNRQQPMQYAPTQHRRSQYGNSDSLSGYAPVMGAASNGRGANANNDDDDESGSSFGPNFGANFDSNSNDGDGEGSNAGEGQTMGLNQAASGYPGSQGDYNNDAAGASFGFGGQSGYGPSMDGAEFGPSDVGYGNEGRRAKSASSPMSSRNFGSDDDAGAPQYGPNSAVNSGDADDEGRAGYAPEGQSDNDNDDE